MHAPPPRPLTGGDKWTVFLSYRSINRPRVLNLCDVLTQHGHVVFLDQVGLKAGDELVKGLFTNAHVISPAGGGGVLRPDRLRVA